MMLTARVVVPLALSALSLVVPACATCSAAAEGEGEREGEGEGEGDGVPPAPTGLSAAPGDGTVVLAWTGSTAALGYRVKRGGVSGGPYQQVGAPSTSPFVDTGLTNGTTYYYVATAMNAAGESAASAEVAATPGTGNQPPTAALEVDPTSGTLPLTVEVDATASADPDGNVASVTIDFGDGATLAGAAGSHTFMSAGVFSVVATVTDDDGATDTAAVTVAVGGGSGGPVTPILLASRTTGYAPLAVHFDATNTFSTTPGIGDAAQGGAFRQITHAFNFGDPGSGTHAITGMSRNTEPFGGGLAAHVFRTPGSYTVTVTSTDGVAESATASVTITVGDPTSLPTFAISRTGDFTGAPAGATHLTRTTVPAFASNTRYFFRRGEDWSGASLGIQDPLTNVHVDAYGVGEAPIFNSVSVGTDAPDSASFANDIRISNVTSRAGFRQSNGSRVLFDGCAALGTMSMSGAGYSPVDPFGNIPQSAYQNAEEIFFVGCRMQGDGSSGDYMYYGNGSRLVFLDSSFGGTAQGTVRIVGWERGVMRHCRIESPYADSSVHALKLHSGGPNAYATNWLASGGQNPVTQNYVNWTTSKVVIADSTFGGREGGTAGASWTVAVSPQNDEYGAQGAEPLEDIILERNTFVRSGGVSLDLAWAGRRLTSRGNVTSQGGAPSIGPGHDIAPAYDGPYFAE
ncbi:MAG: hypothetical protein A2138_04995 [Deltaproteobacteria bacterium RBG_16_71_12]|nr:MAG: hypothetical protein A2138_04995 [Deltaproteobacteria bacterium RBG_16_71_12]